MRIRRVDALEAGIRFMTWVFSDGRASADEVRAFAGQLGMNWDEVEQSLKKNGGTLHLIRDIEHNSAHLGGHVFAWFEVGRNTIFLANVVGTGAPSPLVDSAIPGYRRYLEDAHVPVEERSRLQSLLSMQTSSADEKTVVLSYLRERLRDQAILQDATEQRGRPREANNRSLMRPFALCVVIALAVGALAVADILPLTALPFIVIGSIGAFGVLDALLRRRE